MNREREENIRRENEKANMQFRRQREKRLALLLSEHEVKMETLLAKQNNKENGMVTRKRKSDQLEKRKDNVSQFKTSTTTQPSAPECPVCALKYEYNLCGAGLFII